MEDPHQTTMAASGFPGLRLPNEIINMICSEVVNNGPTGPADLASLARTCRLLSLVAEPLLLKNKIKQHPYIIHATVELGDADALRKLLKAGADPNLVYSPDYAQVHKSWHEEQCEYFESLDERRDYVPTPRELFKYHFRGERPTATCYYHRNKTVRRWLERPQCPRFRPGYRVYPIHLAARGTAESLNILIAAGARLDATCHQFCFNCRYQETTLLDTRFPRTTARAPGQESWHAGTTGGWTALHIALCINMNSNFHTLLSRGQTALFVNADGSQYDDILHHTVAKNHPDIFRFLSLNFPQYRAAINQPDLSGRTPIWIAMLRPTVEPHLLRLLIEHGGALDDEGHCGLTPLIFASGSDGAVLDSVSMFLASGADVNKGCTITSNAPWTKAFLTKDQRFPVTYGSIVRPLDVRITNTTDHGYVFYKRFYETEITQSTAGLLTTSAFYDVKLLLDKGAKLHHSDAGDDRDPVLLAAKNHRLDVLQAIVTHPTFASWVGRYSTTEGRANKTKWIRPILQAIESNSCRDWNCARMHAALDPRTKKGGYKAYKAYRKDKDGFLRLLLKEVEAFLMSIDL